ncbi:Zn(2+)-responsive transcriptional regulator [Shewanella sp. NIFS-20-20]|uniref:Zn(2+)-responsive transcriptional regulator n=1 Tax=Shewanella sp. NIFS-20-20 TaxID=2853806 RepID=UPI001C45CE2B|nr:Zn(2+)-responsive transcriptional regulator [Shewanella sp. NIFS-20-20]MBV7316950.1 Zn(2+)-responsive transcriptional regulator [Shewanella sp. NIFS-20-20]
MYKIGELASLCHIKTDTLRFYEKHGLLTPSERSEAGYRLYTAQDAERLQFILRAKAVGFSLSEINELLSIDLDRSHWQCVDVKAVVDTKLAQVTAKIQELQHFKDSLNKLSESCCGGPESAECCSILEALESATGEIKPENHGDCEHDCHPVAIKTQEA